MMQFIQGNDAAFTELESRARQACIRFRDQPMPNGCHPAQVDIGFEIAPDGAKLHVKRGIAYTGNHEEIRSWLASGTKLFPSFGELKAWIQGPLAKAYQIQVAATTGHAVPSAVSPASQLTDMPAVQEAIRNIGAPLYLDEDRLHTELGKRILGQDAAIQALSEVTVRHCARRKPSRPAVLFATGPSGVGKTRSAEELAKVLRELDEEDGGYSFLRLDMTEYQEAHRVSQLIGSPQGYVGHGQGSQLIDALRANPHTIVLFDEIEKAHPSILRVLMNTMDAGRLSSASSSTTGREVDCRQAIFIFTSNINSREILSELENRNSFGDRNVEDEVCRRHLHASGIAPEIIGRIGRFLVFRPLDPETRAAIMALAVSEVAAEYGIEVTYVDPEIIVELLRNSRSSDFGVRPERYMIDNMLGSVFAKASMEQITNPVKVTGPPWRCEPIGNPAPVEQNSDSTNRNHSVN